MNASGVTKSVKSLTAINFDDRNGSPKNSKTRLVIRGWQWQRSFHWYSALIIQWPYSNFLRFLFESKALGYNGGILIALL